MGLGPRPDLLGPRAEGLTGAGTDGSGRRAGVCKLGTGRTPEITVLAGSIKGCPQLVPRAIMALRPRGVQNSVADASSHFPLLAKRRDPFPGRLYREKFRDMGAEGRGCFGVEMAASDSGEDARAKEFRSPTDSAFESSPDP